MSSCPSCCGYRAGPFAIKFNSHQLAQSEQFGILKHSEAEASLPRHGGHHTVLGRDHTVCWMGPQGDQEGIQNPETLLGLGEVGGGKEGGKAMYRKLEFPLPPILIVIFQPRLR